MAQKTYTRINWEDDPSVNTPLSANNLNKMDAALDAIDNRVVELMDGTSGSDFTGATQSVPGKHGLVPAPAAGDQNDVLRGDGTWGDAPHATNADTATNATNATNATTASKLGSTTVGSNTKPIYLNNGVPTPVNKNLATAEQLSNGSVTKIGSSNVGGPTTPIYLNNGVPTAGSYTLGKSVPADAKFTDTTYESLPESEGGTQVSLVTTDDKFRWNHASGASSADEVSYDNAESGLEAENVQDAIDELTILADADQSIVAIWDKSPAIRAHAKDSYVHYNGVTYIVTSAISIGDTLTVGTNIAVPTLEEGTVIYIPEVDGTFTADMVDYDDTTSGLSAADVQHAIDALDNKKEDVLDLDAHTITGNPLSFTTDSAQVASNASIAFEPIQAGSGNPSPSNPRAISGYNEIDLTVPGKNLWSGGDMSGTRYVEGSLVLPAGKYTISSVVTSSDTDASTCQVRIYYYDAEGVSDYKTMQLARNTRTNASFTLSFPSYSVRFFASQSSNTSQGDTFSFTDIQIEAGSTATPYEPYNLVTDIQIQLDATLYGGTLDVESGKLVIDKGILTLDGSQNWSGSLTYGFYTEIDDMEKLSDYSDKIFCECLKTVATGSIVITTDKSISGFKDTNSAYPNQNWIYVGNTDWGDATEIRTYFTSNPTKVVYPLATPITIQLSPHVVRLLSGANVVTTNGTSLTLTYRDGNVATLNDLTSIGEAVNGLGDMIDNPIDNICSVKATGTTNNSGAQINSGTYFYLDGVFCKALSNIAADATFTLNTNYKRTTIAEELLALA